MLRQKKIVYGLLLATVIVLTFTVNVWFLDQFTSQCWGDGEVVTITHEGEVDPPDAPIDRNGNVYTFTDNINGSIVIEKDDIVLDGANHILQGTGSGQGIYLSERNNINIKNLEVNNFHKGFRISQSSNINISENTIANNEEYGIYLKSSPTTGDVGNYIFNNTITNNSVWALVLEDSPNNSIVGNYITNNTRGILLSSGAHTNSISENIIENVDNTAICADAVSGSNNIFGNNVTNINNESGIKISSSHNIIFGNKIACESNYSKGIDLISTSNNNISQNDIANGYEGICLGMAFINVVSENNLTNNAVGIEIGFSNDNFVYGNTATNNTYGISIWDSSNNTLRDNTMTGNEYNFGVSGDYREEFMNDVDGSNTVDEKSIVYLIDKQDLIIDPKTYPNAGYVAVVGSKNIVVRNLDMANNKQCVYFAFTDNSLIQNVTITNSRIDLSGSSNNIIYGNTLTNSGVRAISLDSSSYNDILRNNMTGNMHGIYLGWSHGNVIRRNNIANSSESGVTFKYSSYNEIYENNIFNSNFSCSFTQSSTFSRYNIIYHNNFENNLHSAYFDDDYQKIDNSWDNGSRGNYWSDYEEKYPDATELDGVWDTPYELDGIWETDHDWYPLVNPWIPTTPIIAVFLDPINVTSYDPVRVSVLCDSEADTIIFSYKDAYGQWCNTSMIYNSTFGLWTVIVPPHADNYSPYTLNSSVVEFYIRLFDSSGNKTLSGHYSYEVKFLIAEDITGPDGRPDGEIDMRDVGRVARLFGHKY